MTTERTPKPGSGATLVWIAAASVLSVLGLWIALAGEPPPSAESGATDSADLRPLPDVLEIDTTLPPRARPDALSSASRR